MAENYPKHDQAQKYADDTAESHRLAAEQVAREESARVLREAQAALAAARHKAANSK